MDEALKQRLIGALVLLALGVIFVPVLFEPDHRRDLDRTSQIPPAPGIEPVRIEQPQPVADLEPVKPAQEMYRLSADGRANEEAKAAADTADDATLDLPEEPILDSKGVARAWAVQVGSFSEDARAQALLEQLLEEGYRAWSSSMNTGDGRMTRVYVGPQVERSKVIQLKRELDNKLKLDTLIVLYTP